MVASRSEGTLLALAGFRCPSSTCGVALVGTWGRSFSAGSWGQSLVIGPARWRYQYIGVAGAVVGDVLKRLVIQERPQ